MITEGCIKIVFKNTEYKVNLQKLQTALSILENRKVVLKDEKEISELLKKYKLYDEGFLSNINKI